MTDLKSVVVPQPKRLSVSSNEEGLIQIELQLRQRKVTVVEADYSATYQKGVIVGDILDDFEPDLEEGQDPPELNDMERVRQNLLLNVYAPLAACSTGDVPDKDAFLKMSEVDIDFWVSEAKQVNPTWFTWLDELQGIVDQAGEEAKKKGLKSRTKSSKS